MVKQKALMIGAAVGLITVGMLIRAWTHQDDGIAQLRLDATSLRSLPADRTGEERLLKHLGSLLPAKGGMGAWRQLNSAQRAVLVTLNYEWTVELVGVAAYRRTQAEDPDQASSAEIAEAYQMLGCSSASDSKKTGELRWVFINEHADEIGKDR